MELDLLALGSTTDLVAAVPLWSSIIMKRRVCIFLLMHFFFQFCHSSFVGLSIKDVYSKCSVILYPSGKNNTEISWNAHWNALVVGISTGRLIPGTSVQVRDRAATPSRWLMNALLLCAALQVVPPESRSRTPSDIAYFGLDGLVVQCPQRSRGFDGELMLYRGSLLWPKYVVNHTQTSVTLFPSFVLFSFVALVSIALNLTPNLFVFMCMHAPLVVSSSSRLFSIFCVD